MNYRVYLRLTAKLIAFCFIAASPAGAQSVLQDLVTGSATGDGSGPELEQCVINVVPGIGMDDGRVVAI